MNTHKEPIINYTTHCPQCDSEEIEMIGDREYNDEWHCEDCDTEFGTFVQKEHIVELVPLEPKETPHSESINEGHPNRYGADPFSQEWVELEPTPPSQTKEETTRYATVDGKKPYYTAKEVIELVKTAKSYRYGMDEFNNGVDETVERIVEAINKLTKEDS